MIFSLAKIFNAAILPLASAATAPEIELASPATEIQGKLDWNHLSTSMFQQACC